jgi:hypothetical protein
MRVGILLLLSVLLLHCAGKQIITKTVDSEAVLYWSEIRRLTWDDFKGEPILAGGAPACEILIKNPASLERKNLLSKTRLVAECYLDKNASWAVKSRVTETSLLYCQTLFDIYELYTRKLRAAFVAEKFDPNNATRVFNEITNRNNDALVARIHEFRLASEMGTNVEKTQYWAEKIKFELSQLQEHRTDLMEFHDQKQ